MGEKYFSIHGKERTVNVKVNKFSEMTEVSMGIIRTKHIYNPALPGIVNIIYRQLRAESWEQM